MSTQKSSFGGREKVKGQRWGVWCREKVLTVRVVLCSEGQGRCKAGASVQMGRPPPGCPLSQSPSRCRGVFPVVLKV